MSEIPNISEEYNYFEKLFENAEKEQIGDLYKKDLYIMKEDLDTNKYKTTLKLMHDTLIQKFMCEEYTEFIPKNEVAQLIYPPEKKEANNNNNKSTQREDAADKELLEEYTYLKELYRLNYLTFSPFALEYFEKISEPKKSNNKNNNANDSNNTINDLNNNNDNNKESNNNDLNMNNKNDKEEANDEQKEKDNKLLKLLNFDYNSFELNNDLLFNISQGFIDISKLKESNLKITDKNKDNKENSDNEENENEFELYEYDEELNQELINKTKKFAKLYENNLFLKGAIIRFKGELSQLPLKCKNKDINEFYKYWDAEFSKLEKQNERMIKRREEDERKKQLLKQKQYLDRLKMDKENEEKKKIGEENEFLNQLRKIQNDAKVKNGIKEKKTKGREKLKRKKKKVNRSVSPVKQELIKSNKKYYCSGFNMYKEILSNKHRNGSAKH